MLLLRSFSCRSRKPVCSESAVDEIAVIETAAQLQFLQLFEESSLGPGTRVPLIARMKRLRSHVLVPHSEDVCAPLAQPPPWPPAS